jgi:excinuclease ABC subunit B
VPDFEVVSDYKPLGDQPRAIEELVYGVQNGVQHQTLLGITGSGKTATMSWVIEKLQRPALIMAPNKTLAAQLYGEFRKLFPKNAVEYFVSYYDYYQPEAYIPTTDTYIEKDSSINDEIDKLRHSATRSVLTRRDTIVVASVSCIYGLGSPETYGQMHAYVEQGAHLRRDDFTRKLVEMLYDRNDLDFHRGTFRVRGDVVEVFPAYEDERAIRIEFFGDEVDAIAEIDPLRGRVLAKPSKVLVYPNSHYVQTQERLKRAIDGIREELDERIVAFKRDNKLLEAQRIEQRTMYDLEMLEQMGFCHGIENYSRHLSGRKEGEAPPTLIDYFPEDFLCFVDESHVTVPQIGGMFRGDRQRKNTLVDFGFRLPSALDNRRCASRSGRGGRPGDVRLGDPGRVRAREERRRGRRTDHPSDGSHGSRRRGPARQEPGRGPLGEIRARVALGDRVLVTTLTKRMAGN